MELELFTEIDELLADAGKTGLNESHLLRLTALHRSSLETGLEKRAAVAVAKDALADTLLELANCNYRIKSLEHRLESTESIDTIYQDFLDPDVGSHDGTKAALQQILEDRKSSLAELEKVKKELALIQTRRESKESKLSSLDDEIQKSLSLSPLSSLLSSHTIERHKDALLAKSLPPVLHSIWKLSTQITEPELRPTVMVPGRGLARKHSSSSSAEDMIRLKVPLTESVSLIMSMLDQGGKDDVLAFSVFSLRQSLKHVPQHYFFSMIPVKYVERQDQDEDETTRTGARPLDVVNQGGDACLVYGEVQANGKSVSVDWVDFFAALRGRVVLLEDLEKTLDQIKLNPNFGQKKTSPTKLLQSKLEIIKDATTVSLTFKREIKLLTTVCEINPLGLATFTDLKEKSSGGGGDEDKRHFSAILQRVNGVQESGLEAQVSTMASCLDICFGERDPSIADLEDLYSSQS